MALGAPVSSNPNPSNRLATQPTQITNPWVTIRDEGNLGQDAVSITDPDAQIDGTGIHVFKVKEMGGTTLRLAMAYSGTVTTPPSVVVFGRYNETQRWERLSNRDGSTAAVPITAAANDPQTTISTVTRKVTQPARTAQAWDLNGCAEVLVGVEIAQAGGSNDSLLAKVI